jgi:hypothetical protein
MIGVLIVRLTDRLLLHAFPGFGPGFGRQADHLKGRPTHGLAHSASIHATTYATGNHDVSTFTGTVGGHAGTAITVTTTRNIDTGAGFSTIKPTSGATLTSLTFTPTDDTLFSFRGQLAPVGDTGVINVAWTDSNNLSGTLQFTGISHCR